MSPQADAMPAPAHKVRPFYWSVRRELWENPALYLAPLAVAALVLLAYAFATTRGLNTLLRAAASSGPAPALNLPFAAAAGAALMTSAIVGVFYCLGALHGERRDRSILFWKSLPVSDLTTVLSKAAIPLLVQPLIILGVAVGTQLVMLAWSTILLLANGVDPSLMWSRLHLPLMWTMLPYGLVVNLLWDAPVFGWLLLVSAWAKRMTFVWAVAPWLGLALFEALAFRSRNVLELVRYRVFGGFDLAFTVPGENGAPITSLSQVDVMAFLANPGLWTGLLFGAACLAACVWLRRRRDPI